MSETVKLIVEISTPPMNDHERWALARGTLLDSVKAEIQESMYCDKDTRLVENANASGLKKALEIIDSFGKGE